MALKTCTQCAQPFVARESRRRRCDACRTAHDLLGSRWLVVRAQVLREEPSCFNCPSPATEVDHIVPLSRGGDPYDRGNLRGACKPCNSSKGNRLTGTLPAVPERRMCPVDGCGGMDGTGRRHLHIPSIPPTDAERAAGFDDQPQEIPG